MGTTVRGVGGSMMASIKKTSANVKKIKKEEFSQQKLTKQSQKKFFGQTKRSASHVTLFDEKKDVSKADREVNSVQKEKNKRNQENKLA